MRGDILEYKSIVIICLVNSSKKWRERGVPKYEDRREKKDDWELCSQFLSIFQQTLSFMLEVEVLQDENEKLQIISTLESTEEGKACYEALCLK